jgi:hypothetical protein
MPEAQNQEYKSVRKDEYLKWIYSFANPRGSCLIIGKDDKELVHNWLTDGLIKAHLPMQSLLSTI